MSRYTGPAYKKSRKLGFSTLENGKELARRPYAPGIHGTSRRRKLSEYGIQLEEKQKVRFMYGLTEKQFAHTFEKAAKMKGIAGENFLKLLESRLDNVVYRMGIGASRAECRQIVNHGHICVNGKRVNIASYRVNVGDVITIKESKQELEMFKDLKGMKIVMPKWLEFNTETLTGKVIALPVREDIDTDIKEQLIVELYSR